MLLCPMRATAWGGSQPALLFVIQPQLRIFISTLNPHSWSDSSLVCLLACYLCEGEASFLSSLVGSHPVNSMHSREGLNRRRGRRASAGALHPTPGTGLHPSVACRFLCSKVIKVWPRGLCCDFSGATESLPGGKPQVSFHKSAVNLGKCAKQLLSRS